MRKTAMNDADKRRLKNAQAASPVMCCCLLLLLVCFARYDGYTLPAWWRDSHSGVVAGRRMVTSEANEETKQIALTFDDGPDPRYTPRILDILRHYHVKATFFVEGRFVRAYPDLARRILAEGHVLGNHTDTHPYLNRQSAEGVHAEIDGCDQALQTTLHLRTFLFRPPRGLWNPIIYQAVKERGDHLILWTVALEHHDAPTPPAMAARALRLLRSRRHCPSARRRQRAPRYDGRRPAPAAGRPPNAGLSLRHRSRAAAHSGQHSQQK